MCGLPRLFAFLSCCFLRGKDYLLSDFIILFSKLDFKLAKFFLEWSEYCLRKS
jgi:hypothetical protein